MMRLDTARYLRNCTSGYICLVDTETVERYTYKWGNPIVWNIGFAIIRKRDMRIVHAANMVSEKTVRTYAGNRYLTEPVLNQMRREGSRVYPKMEHAINEFKAVLADYHVKDIWAYNSDYDERQLARTCELYGIEPLTGYNWYDIWTAAQVFTGTVKYVQWCYEHDRYTDKLNPKTDAETVAQYLTGDLSLKEKHQALSDVLEFEYIILCAWFKRHRKRPTQSGGGWRPASRIGKQVREYYNIRDKQDIVRVFKMQKPKRPRKKKHLTGQLQLQLAA